MITFFIPANAQEIQIGQAFLSDTTFNPFNGEYGLYSFKMTGGVNLLSDSSLVRVVLIDNRGNHYLIYEAYPLIETSYNYSLQDVCNETCYLDNIKPDSIRVDIINAIASIDQFTYDLTPIYNVHNLQAQAKWVNDSINISIMNQRIIQEDMYWRAGRTGLVKMNFSEKENLFGNKYNIEGFDYYKGGVYENIFRKCNSNSVGTHMVGTFDWRSRHNANDTNSPYYDGDTHPENLRSGWMTPVRNQYHSGTCWVFCALGQVEARLNIYYNSHYNIPNNRHHYDIDLAEQYMLCHISNASCNSGGQSGTVLFTLRYLTCMEEACNQFKCFDTNSNMMCWDTCTSWLPRRVGITNWHSYNFPPGVVLDIQKEDSLKKLIITQGPMGSGWYGIPSHAMVLIGYHIILPNSLVYKGTGEDDPDIIVGSGSRLSNSTQWIFKNSWDTNQPWPSPVCSVGDIGDPDTITGPLNMVHFYVSHQCTDEDHDGYYWWGISKYPQECGCPPGVKLSEEDCNDADPNLGPYVLDTIQSDSLLYSCKPNNCATIQTQFIVPKYQNDTTWKTNQHINHDIVIDSNHCLTIKCEVFFTPGAKIIVKPGGRLLLKPTVKQGSIYPSRLSSSCGQFWGGIELWGNPVSPQISCYQGTLIADTSIVENATHGIETLIPGWQPDWPGGGGGVPLPPGLPTGGIIKATGSTFKNNIIGVELYPYRDGTRNNISFFNHCKFVTDQDLFANVKPENLLKLDGINSINIQNCSFTNNNYSATSLNYNKRGTGLYSYNSQWYILGDSTIFERLKYGIYSMTSALGESAVKLRYATFSSNKYGSYFSGYTDINPFDVDSNKFIFNQNIGNADSLYGLYLNNCSGYNVKGNNFDGTYFNGNVNTKLLGLIVNNTGGRTNYIYDNKFIKLYFALQGLNKNYDLLPAIMYPNWWKIAPYPQTGLCFICNNFESNTNDIIDNYDHNNPPDIKGITYYQRNMSNLIPEQKPAGNIFSSSHCDTCNNYDINMDDFVQDIQYTFHKTSVPTGLRLKPLYIFDSTKVYKDGQDVTYTKVISCPDTGFYPSMNVGGLSSIIRQANYKIDSLSSLLNQLLDDGSTDTLQEKVQNSTSNQSYDIYQSLMNPSPYLSDTVLKSSIEKEDVLPNAMIRDIMVANPQSAKNENLLNAIDKRITPMPDSMWVEILDGRDIIGAEEHLLWELSGWIQTRDFYFHALINHYLCDTIDSWAIDSLVSLLENTNRLEAKYYLFYYYLNRHDFTQADNVLQNIPSEFNLSTDEHNIYTEYSTLLPILQQIYNDTLGYYIQDSLQITDLEQLALNDKNLPGAFARNILISSGIIYYKEPIILETDLKSSRIIHNYEKKIQISGEFKVYPNPCKDYVIAEYTKGELTDLCYINLYDKSGKRIASFSMKHSADQVVIPLQQYPKGNYFLQLFVNGKSKGVKKIILVE